MFKCISLDDSSLKTSSNVNNLEASSSSAVDCPIEESDVEIDVIEKPEKAEGKKKIKMEVKQEINYDEDLGDNWFLDDMDLMETSSGNYY